MKALTDSQLDAYHRVGCVFPIPALSSGEVAYFRGCLGDFLARNSWPLDPRRRHKPHLQLRWVNDLGRHPKLLDAVEDLLGPDLLLLNSWFFIKPAKDPSAIAWHRDSLYGPVGNDAAVTVWLALTDSHRDNGCVRFAAGTHRDPIQRRNAFLRGEAVEEVPTAPVHDALVPAGHISLHHVRIAHCSGPNPTTEMRAAIALRYLAGHSTPERRGEQATPVRGSHNGGFVLEPRPRSDDDPVALAWHARSFQRHSRALLKQALLPPSLPHIASTLRMLGAPANLRAGVAHGLQTLRARIMRTGREPASQPRRSGSENVGMKTADSAMPWMTGPEARRERDHWDMLAHSWPDLYGAASTQHYRRCEIALLKRYFGDLRGKSILKLDLWNEAVNTRLLQWIEGEGARVFGIDLSEITLDRARRNFAHEAQVGHFVQADIRGLPFAEASFDFVYTMGTIEHVREYELAIREVCRVLKPAGRALIGVPHKWDPFLRPLVVWILERLDRYPYSPERAFSGRELGDAVERSGLRVEHRTGLMFVPGIIRLADLFLHVRGIRVQRVTAAATRVFEYAELRWEWARRLGYLVTVVARKERTPRSLPESPDHDGNRQRATAEAPDRAQVLNDG